MGGVSRGLSLIWSLKYRAITGPPEHKDLWLLKYFALSVVLNLHISRLFCSPEGFADVSVGFFSLWDKVLLHFLLGCKIIF